MCDVFPGGKISYALTFFIILFVFIAIPLVAVSSITSHIKNF